MSDTFIRHLVALAGTLVAILIYWAGYGSALRGWWWTILGVAIVYYALYHLIEA